MAKPNIVFFTALPSTIDKGDEAVLAWHVMNVTTVTLTDFDEVKRAGAKYVSPSSTKEYTLEATNDDGSVSESKTITVNKPGPGPTPPKIICTPGEYKCTGVDLYKCSSDGTKWNLETRNSPACKEIGKCPNWWEDFPGAVWCWIISSIEATLGFVSGGFLTLLANIQNFLNKFSTDIAAFLTDPFTKIKSWMGDLWAIAADVAAGITAGITDWWTTTAKTIGDWWNDATQAAAEWYQGIAGTIGNIITHAWSEVIDTVNSTITDFVDWTNNQLLSIWEGIQGWVGEMILGLVDSFQVGFNQGIEDQKNKRKK